MLYGQVTIIEPKQQPKDKIHMLNPGGSVELHYGLNMAFTSLFHRCLPG